LIIPDKKRLVLSTMELFFAFYHGQIYIGFVKLPCSGGEKAEPR
jgi:hypothetical protein